MTARAWQFWVDRGGTFTDVVARAPDGAVHTAKLLSQSPGQYDDAAVAAMRRITGASSGPLPPIELRLGTTVATNALLERAGEPVLLLTTRGFGDALAIGYQERPELFVRAIAKPAPLYAEVAEVAERVGADGTVHRPLDEDGARAALAAAHARGLRAVAIVLMHGYRYPAHEARLAELARALGFTQVSVSHQAAAMIRLIGRGDTTLADAYLSPVLHRYVAGLQEAAGPEVTALFMQSNGGLAAAGAFHGKDAVLSGPAGGIVAVAATAREAGFGEVIGFDMGGTSTDVCHYAGTFEREGETMIAGARLKVPMLRIHTVAAGGGSVCRIEAGRFVVGPQSAGAVPGPRAYRRGGPLTVTDCNVLLGKLQPAHFPALFGPGGDEPLDLAGVRAGFAELVEALAADSGHRLSAEEAAEGFLQIAVANMANAIKAVSVRRGHDASRATLACFGGAGGQHACLVADALGIARVMIHPLAGVLSAYGMGLAERCATREATLALPLRADTMDAIEAALARLGDAAEADLKAQGVAGAILRRVTLSLRHEGTETLIELPQAPLAELEAGFATAHQARFGFTGTAPLVVESARVEAVQPADPASAIRAELPAHSAEPAARVPVWSGGGWRDCPLYDRAGMAEGFMVEGPALVSDPVSTTMVEPGWRLSVDGVGNLILTRHSARAGAGAGGVALDPVRLEIMGALFMALAEEMGGALQRSAASVNIRERLDFSCALFDAGGNLIANAPHMPVHLGSMGESVRTVLARRGAKVDGRARDGRGIRPGDVYALNAPYDGGTHLPDVTVIMPVFRDPADRAPFAFVAARGHHADIGGTSPGSMPPDSTSIDEEGVLLDNVLVVEAGRFLEAELAARLGAGRWPARNIPQNLADLKAQIAACARGADDLRRIAREHGADVVAAYMGHLQDHAEAAVRALIAGLSEGSFAYALDNGATVQVAVRLDRARGTAEIDFTGTSAQLPGNFNAPLPVVRAAVLYVIRTLIEAPIPMNEGCLRPIRLVVPDGCMLRPRSPGAVVAGNVETSQVVTDALFGALGAMAAAQGTMNNLTFGNDTHQYYETIAGGAGAGPGFDGASAVQTHMTNSRLTDPEVLETRFPVLLESFSVRRGSGGMGQWHGGDGVVRRLRFLEPMRAGILANRRRVAPFGLAGGAPGALGRTTVERLDGTCEELASCAATDMAAGEVIVIETPGGGGYGPVEGGG